MQIILQIKKKGQKKSLDGKRLKLENLNWIKLHFDIHHIGRTL